jgi:transcriptional regulator of nitric oxide reductase
MASYPSAKVHRTSRRQLGRGQTIPVAAVIATPSVATTTVTINFSVPVVVNGNLNLHTSVGTLVSQTVNSPTQITQVYSISVATASWSIAANDPAIRSFQGGGLAAASGTF